MAKESSTNRPVSLLLPLLFSVIIGTWTQVLLPSLHAAPPTSTTIDGIDFPETLQKNLGLVGGGTRSKLGLFKVYAAGIYMDKKSGFKDLSKLLDGQETVQETFYDKIANSKYGKAIRLEFHRQIGAETMEEALDEALSTRLEKESREKFNNALHQVLPDVEVPIGMEVTLVCKGDTVFVGSSYSDTKVSVKDKTLCPALFDVYIGKKPVSDEIKEGFGAGALAKVSAK